MPGPGCVWILKSEFFFVAFMLLPVFEGMYIEILPGRENTCNGSHAQQKLISAGTIQDDVTGNGEEQYFQGTSRRVTHQHSNELDADDKIESMLQKDMECIGIIIAQKSWHILYQRDGADDEAAEYDDGNRNLKNIGNQFQPTGNAAVLLPASCHIFFILGWGEHIFPFEDDDQPPAL